MQKTYHFGCKSTVLLVLNDAKRTYCCYRVALALTALKLSQLDRGCQQLAQQILASLRLAAHEPTQQKKLFAIAIEDLLLPVLHFAFAGSPWLASILMSYAYIEQPKYVIKHHFVYQKPYILLYYKAHGYK